MIYTREPQPLVPLVVNLEPNPYWDYPDFGFDFPYVEQFALRRTDDYIDVTPSRIAYLVSSAMLWRFSLSMICFRWVSIVFTLT